MKYIFRNIKSGFSIHKVFTPIAEHTGEPSYMAPCHRADPISMLVNLVSVFVHHQIGGINHMTGGPHYFMLAMPWSKNVLTIHDLVLIHNYKGVRRWVFYWLWFRLPLMFTDVVTCISEATRRDFIANFKFDPSRVHVVYNPVDPDFHYVEKTFCSSCPRILHVGTAWNKNTERVIQALSGVSCHLVIIGPLSEELKDMLKDMDYENHVGVSDEHLREEYEKCDMVSFPSLFEGFGMPIIEAQTVGRPVVTSNLEPMTEIAGGAACLVNPESVESIRDGFLRVMNDNAYRETLVSDGLANARRFNIDTIVSQYKQIYNTLL